MKIEARLLFLIALVLLASFWASTCRAQFLIGDARRAYTDHFPEIEESSVFVNLGEQVRDTRRTLVYDSRSMPRVFQEYSTGLAGLHYGLDNIAGGADPSGGDAFEFPWRDGGGTHGVAGLIAYKAIVLPLAPDGSILPIVYHSHRAPTPGLQERQIGFGWRFPHGGEGTQVVEVLELTMGNGRRIPFEVRVRVRSKDIWDISILKPFPTAIDFADWLEERYPDWKVDADLATLIPHLRSPATLIRQTQKDRHPQAAFNVIAYVDSLPRLGGGSARQRDALKEKPFEEQSEAWKGECSAPTSRFAGTIVPVGYTSHFAGFTRISCARCHAQTNQHVDRFGPPRRDWYGRVSGSDGILSFHPFDVRSVADSGNVPRTIAMNPALERARLLVRYDRLPVEYRQYYSTIKGLD